MSAAAAETGHRGRVRFTDGQNCAESVLAALSQTPGLPELQEGLGAGFTRGIGHGGCLCGALAAGVVAISAFVDAEGLEPVARRERAEELSAELTRRFTERWGATCCRVIRRGLEDGSAEANAHCASITEHTAALVAEVIADARDPVRSWSARDRANAAGRMALDLLAGAAIGAAPGLFAPGLAAPGVLAGAAFGLIVGAAVESRAGAPRRIGRALKTAGVVVAGVVMLALTVAPSFVAPALVDPLMAGGVAASVARVAVAAAIAVTAAVSVHRYLRYR